MRNAVVLAGASSSKTNLYRELRPNTKEKRAGCRYEKRSRTCGTSSSKTNLNRELRPNTKEKRAGCHYEKRRRTCGTSSFELMVRCDAFLSYFFRDCGNFLLSPLRRISFQRLCLNL